MAFIRIKEIPRNGKRYSYGYLVKNRWRKRPKSGKCGSRQQVSLYLGKVMKPDKIRTEDFFTYMEIEDPLLYMTKSKKEIVSDLCKHCLWQYGFDETEPNMVKDELIFLSSELGFISKSSKKEKILLMINEGFLCEYTINDLLNFKKETDDEHFAATELAKKFVEAGFEVPKELFVEYFQKV